MGQLNLISDLFSRVVFEDKSACQELIDIILGTGFQVEEISTQKELTNLTHHSVVLDIVAKTKSNKTIHIEFQISDDEDHLRRVRYCTGSIDTHTLEKGTPYSELPDIYHVFITLRDFIGKGKTVYQVVRRTDDGEKISMDNGVHELYINLEVPLSDESELAGLLRYMKQTTKENEKSYFSNIVRSVNDCRKQGKDVDIMEMKYYNSEEFYQAGREAGREEGIKEGIKDLIMNMLESDMDEQMISKVTKQPLNYIRSVKEECMCVQEKSPYHVPGEKP